MLLFTLFAVIFSSIGAIVLSQDKEIHNNYVAFTVGGLLILIWGFTYVTAPDMPGYIAYFKQYVYDWSEKGFVLSTNNEFEIGYKFINGLFKTLSGHFYVLQAALFTVELSLIMISLNRMFKMNLMIALICGLFFILPSNLLGAMRQGIAISLFIFALPYILERKIILYMAIIILASLFHKSALLLSLFYFIPLLNDVFNRKWLLIAILLICNVLYVAGFSASNYLDSFLNQAIMLSDNLSDYTRYTDEKSGSDIISNFGFLKVIELDIIYILSFFVVRTKSKPVELFKLLFLFYFILNMLIGGILVHRISYYFGLAYYILFFIVVCSLSKKLLRSYIPGYLTLCLYITAINFLYFNNETITEFRNVFLSPVSCPYSFIN